MIRKNDFSIKVKKYRIRLLSLLTLILWGSLSLSTASAASTSSIDFSVLPNPLSLEIITLKPAGNNRTKITTVITNNGHISIRDVKVYLELPDNIKGKNKPLIIKTLKPLSSKATAWLVKAEKPGDYDVTVRAKGTLDGLNQLIAAETTTRISFFVMRLWGWVLKYDLFPSL